MKNKNISNVLKSDEATDFLNCYNLNDNISRACIEEYIRKKLSIYENNDKYDIEATNMGNYLLFIVYDDKSYVTQTSLGSDEICSIIDENGLPP
jgi:hypothetical protein